MLKFCRAVDFDTICAMEWISATGNCGSTRSISRCTLPARAGRVAARAQHPRGRQDAIAQRDHSIRRLRLRHVKHGNQILVQTFLTDIADNAHNQAGFVLELGPQAMSYHDALAQRVLLRPVLLREGFVEDHHRRAAAGIGIVEQRGRGAAECPAPESNGR